MEEEEIQKENIEKKEMVKKKPVENESFKILLVIFVVASLAISFVMFQEYNKKFDGNIMKLVTENIVSILISSLSIIGMISTILYMAGSRLFRKIEVNSEYEGEIATYPAQTSPVYVSFLNDGFSKQGRDITVALLDFIKRGYIVVEQGMTIEDILDNDKVVKLFKNNDLLQDNLLNKVDSDIMRLIFAEVGDGSCVSTRTLREELLNNPIYPPKLEGWQKEVKEALKTDDIIKERKKSKKSIIFMIFALLSLVFLKDLTVEFVILIYSIIQIFLAKAIFIDTDLIYFTKNGGELYSKWMAFKKYLETNPDALSEDGLNIIIYKIALDVNTKKYTMFKIKDRFKK